MREFLVDLQVKYKYDFQYREEDAKRLRGNHKPLPELIAPALDKWVPQKLAPNKRDPAEETADFPAVPEH